MRTSLLAAGARLAMAALLAVTSLHAAAQEWPTKPIRMIAPQPPGGGPERVIRGIAQGLSQRLGQPVVVDYKPGAAGNLGTADLARSPADGYTWMLAAENSLTINPSSTRAWASTARMSRPST